MHEHYDVIVLGAGPAGLILTTWMARCGISALLLDRKTRVDVGRADGLEPRSLEILESFDLIDTLWPQMNRTMECCIWGPDKTGNIHRRRRKRNFSPELSRYQEATLEQGRIEQVMLENLRKFSNVEIINGANVKSLKVQSGTEDSSHPVLLEVEGPIDDDVSSDYDDSLKEPCSVYAQYLVGCDGAHSWTRHQIGADLVQERTGQLWGVVDFIPKTDFPDIRNRCIVTSKPGTMMVIPREDDLVRLYVPLSHLGISKSAVTPEKIFEAAKDVLEPYELSHTHLRWWTTYEVARGITSAYSKFDRVFIAGDAAHVHSPKAGQGMNISIQDAFNLGWKLASVVNRSAGADLLTTYESERRPIAERLMELDVQFNKLFSNKDDGETDDAVNAVVDAMDQEHEGSAPITASYFPVMSERIAQAGLPKLEETSSFATNVEIGKRLPIAGVVRHCDARPLSILCTLPGDGRWRVLVFSGNISNPVERKRVDATSLQLEELCRRHGTLLDPLLVHCASRDDLELLSVPSLFLPQLPETGYRYDKVCLDEESLDSHTGSTYELYGVDESKGALLLVRPDQVVGWTGALQDVESLGAVLHAYLYQSDVER